MVVDNTDSSYSRVLSGSAALASPGVGKKCRLSGPTLDFLNQILHFNKVPWELYIQRCPGLDYNCDKRWVGGGGGRGMGEG